jgi:hypothetical protein
MQFIHIPILKIYSFTEANLSYEQAEKNMVFDLTLIKE